MLDAVISSAPLLSRIIGIGVCMGNDTIRPSMAINKEIEVRFVVGYSPLEFRETLHMLAEGKVDPAPLLTGVVGLAGVAAAFDALAEPDEHAKILIDPQSQESAPMVVDLP
jgi:threonine dehydrogenase-like Zn-dependent dehydrogenase